MLIYMYNTFNIHTRIYIYTQNDLSVMIMRAID